MYFRCPPFAYLLVPLRVRHSPLTTGPFLLASLPIYRRIQPRLPINLDLPLKANPEKLVLRKVMSYMQRHMHIETKADHLVSSLSTNAHSRRHHSIEWVTNRPTICDIHHTPLNRTMRDLNMPFQLWIYEGLVAAGEP